MSSSAESGDSDVAMESNSNSVEPTSFKPFTKAERIQQLNDIDKSITQLLRSAGMAVKSLTSLQSSASGRLDETPKDFPSAANTYLDALHSVDIRLKRQIHGLVESGIITKETQVVFGKPDQKQDAVRAVADRGWDVGFLNTRSGKVGRDMEAELWAKAKGFLQELERKASDDEKVNGEPDDTDMAEKQ